MEHQTNQAFLGKSASVSDGTIIRKGREAVKLSNLKADESIVVIGSPNEEGQLLRPYGRSS